MGKVTSIGNRLMAQGFAVVGMNWEGGVAWRGVVTHSLLLVEHWNGGEVFFSHVLVVHYDGHQQSNGHERTEQDRDHNAGRMYVFGVQVRPGRERVCSKSRDDWQPESPGKGDGDSVDD